MLSREDNNLLCKVGRKRPMGQMLRRYWIPAAVSADLSADGPPRRIPLTLDSLDDIRNDHARTS
jgi:phthalate 4,5-dioxygenase